MKYLGTMDIHIPFASVYRIEPARELPGSGNDVVYFPPQDSTPRVYETVVVFRQEHTAPWYGVFATRSPREGGLTFACTMPDPNLCCVSSLGTGHIINAAQRSEWKEIGLYPVIQVLPVQSHSLLLLSSFTKIVAFSRSGLLWASGHLVHDDLRINGIKKEHIECTGWDPSEGRAICFEVDLFTGLQRC
jgi:hypothetical protein